MFCKFAFAFLNSIFSYSFICKFHTYVVTIFVTTETADDREADSASPSAGMIPPFRYRWLQLAMLNKWTLVLYENAFQLPTLSRC